MKKLFLTALAVAYSVMLVSVAKAELSLSGYQEFYMGSADQSTSLGSTVGTTTDTSFNGLSNGRFTRLIAVAKTTLDSGIEVTGTYTVAKDNDAGGDADTGQVAVDQNDISFSGGFGSIALGNNFSAGTMMHYRGTTLVPTAEIDNDQVHRFITVGAAARGYGRYDEAAYALDGMKIRYMSNIYDGFSLGVSYEPCMQQHGNTASATDCNTNTAPSEHGQYTDLLDTVLKYQAEFDGVNVGATYGYQTGNTNIQNNVQYNDLKGTSMSGQVSTAGFTLIARRLDLGDSGQIKNNTDDGEETSNTFAARYDVGNFSLGVSSTETEKKVTAQDANNTGKYRVVSAGYKLGGGVNIETAFITIEQKAGTTKDTDADIILTKLSFGF
jgi:hypothetical protein